MTDIDQQPTASRNGKRRQKSPMERALGKRQNDDDEGTEIGDVLRIDFDGVTLSGKVVKVGRRAGCRCVRLVVEFVEEQE